MVETPTAAAVNCHLEVVSLGRRRARVEVPHFFFEARQHALVTNTQNMADRKAMVRFPKFVDPKEIDSIM